MAKAFALPGSDIPFTQFRAFADAAKDEVMHGFFGRRGGVSTGIYAGLNCGPGSGDDPEKIQENRARVAAVLGAQPENLLSLYQIHSATCLRVTQPWTTEIRPQADAMVTDVPGMAIGILAADCTPVLFRGVAKGKPVIGAAHAGWRGAIGGVLDSTVDTMVRDYDVDPASLRVAIGPCIQKKSYEVSTEFPQPFLEQNPENERFFQAARKAGHFMFDLPGYCAARLQARGIRQIVIDDADTYSREADYYSFRRKTHRDEPDYGRQISAVMIV